MARIDASGIVNASVRLVDLSLAIVGDANAVFTAGLVRLLGWRT